MRWWHYALLRQLARLGFAHRRRRPAWPSDGGDELISCHHVHGLGLELVAHHVQPMNFALPLLWHDAEPKVASGVHAPVVQLQVVHFLVRGYVAASHETKPGRGRAHGKTIKILVQTRAPNATREVPTSSIDASTQSTRYCTRQLSECCVGFCWLMGCMVRQLPARHSLNSLARSLSPTNDRLTVQPRRPSFPCS